MGEVKVVKDVFGKLDDGRDVLRFTFTNKNNVTVRIINYGCIITDVLVPDRNGKVDDITLGYDDMEGYKTNPARFGNIVGRFGGRITNGKFTLDGEEYTLAANDPPNHVHGGVKGFEKMLWDASLEGTKLHLTYVSPDGEEGYPGELTTTLTYQLNNDNELIMFYTATTTKATPINLLNHAFFNLAGEGFEHLDDHLFTVNADSYIQFTDKFIPTGQIVSVEGSLHDLRRPTPLGVRLNMDNIGFTINYCLGEGHKMKHATRIDHPPTGRWMEVHTTEQSLQTYYAWGFKGDIKGKGGHVYKKYSAFSMEPMACTDAINHADFPDCVLRPGKTYHHITKYKFGVSS